MSQANGTVSTQDTQQAASTVATPAGKEASSVEPSLGTPAPASGGSFPTPDNASPTAGSQQGGTNSSTADVDAVSVKQLIQQRSSSDTVSAALCIVCSLMYIITNQVGSFIPASVIRVLCST